MFEASPAAVWSVITDHAAYPRFMPNVRQTAVVARPDGRLAVSQAPAHPVRRRALLDALGARSRTRLGALVARSLGPHDIAATSGSWELAPLVARAGTLARYRARVDAGRAVPAAIERLLTRSSLPRVIRSVREEVRRRLGASASTSSPTQ